MAAMIAGGAIAIFGVLVGATMVLAAQKSSDQPKANLPNGRNN